MLSARVAVKDSGANWILIFGLLCFTLLMRRNLELEATIGEEYAAVEAFLDEHGRRIWAATESRALGYGSDALVSDATGLSRPMIRKGRRELESGGAEVGRIRRLGARRIGIEQPFPAATENGAMAWNEAPAS